LSLPSGTGTLATLADVAAGGKVLQVVRATDTTERTTTSTSFVDGSLSVTITPQSATSAIILVAIVNIRIMGTNTYAAIRLTDSSGTPISGAENLGNGANGPTTQRFAFNAWGYVISGVTTAVTYKLQYKLESGTSVVIENTRNTGQLFAIEVSA
jgi:hypothetical protein